MFQNAKIEAVLNEGDNLPFGYYSPMDEGKLVWLCNHDQEQRITSVFKYENEIKDVRYLKDMDEAIFHREELVKAGWKKLTPPKVVIKNASGEDRDLSRKERRRLQRVLAHQAKLQNPFKNV